MNRIKEKWNHIPVTVKVSTAYTMCSILQRGLSFITLPLFARLLTTTQYGQVTIFNSWSGIFSIFLTLNLAYGSFSTAMVKFEEDRKGYISSVEGICVVLSVVFLIIYLPFNHIWNSIFELPTFLVSLMVLEILCSTATQLWSGEKRFEYKYISVVAITLLSSAVSPIIQYIFVSHAEEKGYARIIGAAITTCIIGGCFFIYNAVQGKKLFNKKYWKYALGFNVPLLAYYLSQTIFNQSDRIMIGRMVGTDKAAIYGVAYTLAMMLNFVLNAINNSYVPWYYGKIKEGKLIDNKNVSLGIAAFMALLLSGVIWFAPEIILVMAGPQYAEAKYVFPPVAISLLLLFYSQMFINVEFYYEEKKKLVWSSIGAAIVNLVLNWIFIRIFGYVAAAYTTLVSYTLFAGANCLAMKHVLKEKNVEDNAYNYSGLLLLLVGFIAITVLGVMLYPMLIIRCMIAASVLIMLAVKHRILIDFYHMLKKRNAEGN